MGALVFTTNGDATVRIAWPARETLMAFVPALSGNSRELSPAGAE
jgi:hypothetical protein